MKNEKDLNWQKAAYDRMKRGEVQIDFARSELGEKYLARFDKVPDKKIPKITKLAFIEELNLITLRLAETVISLEIDKDKMTEDSEYFGIILQNLSIEKNKLFKYCENLGK